MATNDRPLSTVLQDIIQNIQDIVRSEVRLAKSEIRDELSKAKAAGLLLGTGALCGTFAMLFLLFTIVYALAMVMPQWAAALIVAVALALSAWVILNAGLNRLREVHPTPEKTIRSLKEDVEWAKQQTK